MLMLIIIIMLWIRIQRYATDDDDSTDDNDNVDDDDTICIIYNSKTFYFNSFSTSYENKESPLPL